MEFWCCMFFFKNLPRANALMITTLGTVHVVRWREKKPSTSSVSVYTTKISCPQQVKRRGCFVSTTSAQRNQYDTSKLFFFSLLQLLLLAFSVSLRRLTKRSWWWPSTKSYFIICSLAVCRIFFSFFLKRHTLACVERKRPDTDEVLRQQPECSRSITAHSSRRTSLQKKRERAKRDRN